MGAAADQPVPYELTEWGRGPRGRALIAFRDTLRAEVGLRIRYAELKKQFARQHRGNRNAYTNAKSEFVATVLRTAGIDPPARDRLPQ